MPSQPIPAPADVEWVEADPQPQGDTPEGCTCELCRPVHPDDIEPEVDAPTTPTTFGWESEFERNAQPLAAELYRLGHCGDETIHGWHCDCRRCTDDQYSYKVQHDSTVNGEVISKVFTDIDEAVEAMHALQDAAVEADAEPGWNAGLHVHVGRPRSADRAAHFLAFIVWESAVSSLAQGRFTRMRSMNRTVYQDAYDYVTYNVSDYGTVNEYLAQLAKDTADDRSNEVAREMYGRHYESDRHSNLNTNTRFRTWEFRIWNSTRSAWRIEMAVRLALAWRDRDFIDGLLLATSETGNNAEGLLQVISDWGGDGRLTDLVNRQVEYLPIASRTPAEFLVTA